MSLFELNTGSSMVFNLYLDGYDIFSGGYVGYGDAEDGRLNRDKLMLYIDAMDSDSIGTSDVNVMSEKAAKLGAYQNRLEHTIRNLDNVMENTTAAEYRIRDTDMAEEMVEYSKNNILEQAGQAMMAQANQIPQGVLSLLQ